MVTRQFHTKDGVTTRTLTQKEIEEFADVGDDECRRVIAEQEYDKATTDSERLEILKKLDFNKELTSVSP